jgi:hypothetical protein
MVIEIGSIALGFNLAMEGNQTYFNYHLMTYCPFKVMVIGWQPNRFNHYAIVMTNHLRWGSKSTPFGQLMATKFGLGPCLRHFKWVDINPL